MENSDLKCLQSKYVSSLYRSIFLYFYLYICKKVWLVSTLFHAYCELRKKGKTFKKKITLLPGQDWLGQQLMQQKNTWKLINLLAFTLNWCQELFKTDMTFFIMTFELTSKMAKEKKVTRFSGQFIECFLLLFQFFLSSVFTFLP